MLALAMTSESFGICMGVAACNCNSLTSAAFFSMIFQELHAIRDELFATGGRICSWHLASSSSANSGDSRSWSERRVTHIDHLTPSQLADDPADTSDKCGTNVACRIQLLKDLP